MSPPAGSLRQTARRHPVLAFLAVSFASSWAYGLAFLRFVDPVVEYPLSQILSLPFAWGPLVGAVAVVAATTDTSARAWLRDAVDVSVPLRWLALGAVLVAVYGPTALTATSLSDSREPAAGD